MGEERYANLKLIILALSFVLSLSSLALYIFGVPGEVSPMEPSSYAILRGYDQWPSDYLIIPLSWMNTASKAAVIRQPELILYEINENGQRTGNQSHFYLAGEFPDFSKQSFSEPYTIIDSLIIEPESVKQRVLVFHTEYWWNPSNTDHDFRFIPLKNYSVDINYFKNLDKTRTTMHSLFRLPIHYWSSSTNLSLHDWDYSYLYK